MLAEPVVTLAGVPADDLLHHLALRVYPTGEAGEHRFTFHDGSTVTVQETPDGFTLGFDEAARARRYGVRVADGRPVDADQAIFDVEAGQLVISHGAREVRVRIA